MFLPAKFTSFSFYKFTPRSPYPRAWREKRLAQCLALSKHWARVVHVSSTSLISKYLALAKMCARRLREPGRPESLLCLMVQSKHLDDEYESSEEEREPPAVPPTWRASQPLLTTARPQMAPRPPMALRSQVPSRHVLCLPPRNVTLLQERVRRKPALPPISLLSSLVGQFFEVTHALISPCALPSPGK